MSYINEIKATEVVIEKERRIQEVNNEISKATVLYSYSNFGMYFLISK